MKKHQTVEKRLQDALIRIKNRAPEIEAPIQQDHEITIRMVARESGVSYATIYNHPEIKAEIDAMKSTSLSERYEAQRLKLNDLKQQQQQYLDEIREIKQQRDLALEENYRLSLLVETKAKEIDSLNKERTRLTSHHKIALEKRDLHIQQLLKQINTE